MERKEVENVDPTERIPLGRTDLRVTRLGVGTVPIAGLYEPVSEQRAQATLRRAYEVGVRYFDTAPLYGCGLAEQRLGRFLASISRQEVLVATKVDRLLQDERPDDEPNHAARCVTANSRAVPSSSPLRDRQFKSGSELEVYQQIMDPPFEVRAGFFHVSNRPGLGHELRQDYIEKAIPF
jgi:hypothetical protein